MPPSLRRREGPGVAFDELRKHGSQRAFRALLRSMRALSSPGSPPATALQAYRPVRPLLPAPLVNHNAYAATNHLPRPLGEGTTGGQGHRERHWGWEA